jgi:hypothetical protein
VHGALGSSLVELDADDTELLRGGLYIALFQSDFKVLDLCLDLTFTSAICRSTVFILPGSLFGR